MIVDAVTLGESFVLNQMYLLIRRRTCVSLSVFHSLCFTLCVKDHQTFLTSFLFFLLGFFVLFFFSPKAVIQGE